MTRIPKDLQLAPDRFLSTRAESRPLTGNIMACIMNHTLTKRIKTSKIYSCEGGIIRLQHSEEDTLRQRSASMVNLILTKNLSSLRWVLITSFIIPAITRPVGAFKYTQDISVDKPGLTRCFLPRETTENYRVREEIRLFSPEGQEIPYLFEYPEIERIGLEKTIPRTALKTQFTDDKTIVTFPVPDSFAISGFNIYSGVQEKKSYTIDQSKDGLTWDRIVPPSQMGSSVRMNVENAPPGTIFRLTLDDSLTPPSSGVQVQWVRAPSSKPKMEKVEILYKRTGTSDFGDRFELTAPRRNMYGNAVAVYVEDVANLDLNNVRQTTLYLPSSKESPVYSHLTAIAQLVAPGKGQPPYLMVDMGVAHDDYNSVLYLKSYNGAPVRVLRMEASIMPLSLLFQAPIAGEYKLRFGIDGPATDPVLIYGSEPINTLRNRQKEPGIPLAAIGPIQIHTVYAGAIKSAEWDPLPSTINPQSFRYRARIRVLHSGIQSAEIPGDVFGVSSTGEDWRLMASGKEIPFLIRLRNGQTIIKTHFEKSRAVNGKARWVMEGTFDQVPWINVRFDVKGLFKPTKARLISPTPMGEEVLLEFPWEFDEFHYKKFMSESGKTIPLKREGWPTLLQIGSNGVPVKGNRLILEVDDPSFSLPEPTVTGGTHKIIFKANAEDEIIFYWGDTNLSAPKYPLREDPKIPLTVADQSAHFIHETIITNDTNEGDPEGPEAVDTKTKPNPASPLEHKDHSISNLSDRNQNSLLVGVFILLSLFGVAYILFKK